MESLLIIFLAASAVLWGIAAVIWQKGTTLNLFIKLVSILMLVTALVLLLGVLGMVVVI
ncbi:hypothetical protein LCGC14_1764350 [marine sediment metagenome]|uniref:Uncharacterized protein n=1 Tax=marine sediment metagenome TaxID=412755 RepID=A0A0F9JF38_9ZZZZ